MTVEPSDWSGDAAPNEAPQPATPPAFTAEDLALLGPPDGAVIDDDDPDEIDRKLIASGIFTRESLARHYGRPAGEIAPSRPRPQTPASVDAELSKIDQLRRTDRQGYFKDDATQKNERQLLETKHALESEAKLAATLNPPHDELAKIDTELAAIDKLRSEDRRAYNKNEALQVRERDLLKAKEALTHAAQAQERIEGTVEAALADMPNEEREAFTKVFDALPAATLDVIRDHLAETPIEPARPATDADLKRFASTEFGAELLTEWGRSAGMNLAKVRSRLDYMISTRPNEIAAALELFETGTPKQAKAMLKALAR
jgi:hypothetical protein